MNEPLHDYATVLLVAIAIAAFPRGTKKKKENKFDRSGFDHCSEKEQKANTFLLLHCAVCGKASAKDNIPIFPFPRFRPVPSADMFGFRFGSKRRDRPLPRGSESATAGFREKLNLGSDKRPRIISG